MRGFEQTMVFWNAVARHDSSKLSAEAPSDCATSDWETVWSPRLLDCGLR